MTIILAAILASSLTLGSFSAIEPEAAPAGEQEVESTPKFANASELLDALSTNDKTTNSLTGAIRFTTINALEGDRQQRYGKLAIQRQPDGMRHYSVSFTQLEIDNRLEIIDEQFIFDGRWFIERLPQDKQFNKRELVPAGQTLDPMELMRDAPFWVSVGHNTDRLLASYDADILPSTESLIDNTDFPELGYLAELPHIVSATQLVLTPKPGSGFEDDWEWVRIWINPETLQPALYIKAEWTGDLQIVELFSVETNGDIKPGAFDTTTPDARDGWRIQSSYWRGQGNDQE